MVASRYRECTGHWWIVQCRPLVEAMKELFGCAISAGTLATAVRRCATGLVETELKIKKGLRRSPIIHADETGLRVKGKLAYVHVAS